MRRDLLLLALAVGIAAPTAVSHAAPPAAALAIRLSATARELLKDGMRNHRSDMGSLATAVILLDHGGVARRAADIAAEPRLARPAADDAVLNAALPLAFFALQEKLASDATALSHAAAKADDGAMAKAYGQLTETCVACHALFRTHATSAP